MAIKSNRKIDFEYEFESPNGNGSYSTLLRFYHTEEYGATIAVLGDDGEPAINFPVTMFSEVSAYLTEQGILEERKPPTPQIPYRLPKTSSVPPKPSLSLPKPKFISSKPSFVNPLKIGSKTIRDAVEVDLENDDEYEPIDATNDMIDIIRIEKERLDSIHAAVSGSIPAQSLSNSVEQVDLSEEEINQMLKERQGAKSKAKIEGKIIRRKDE